LTTTSRKWKKPPKAELPQYQYEYLFYRVRKRLKSTNCFASLTEVGVAIALPDEERLQVYISPVSQEKYQC